MFLIRPLNSLKSITDDDVIVVQHPQLVCVYVCLRGDRPGEVTAPVEVGGGGRGGGQ